jgi:hypothetical protein
VVYTKGQGDYDQLIARGAVVSSEPEAILYHAIVVWTPRLYDIRHPDPLGRDGFSRGLRYIIECRSDRPESRPPGTNAEPAVTVVVDEGKSVCPPELHPDLDLLYTQGMGMGIGMLTLSQRPFMTASVASSEASWVVAFRTQLRMDRTKLAGDLGIDSERLGQLRASPNEHEFMVFRQGASRWEGPWEL